MRPLPVNEVLRPERPESSVVARSMNLLLLVPVAGAFFQLLLTHRIPSMAWVFVLLGAAFATRLFKSRTTIRERPALLGHDGVALAGGFVPATEMRSVANDGDVVRVTLHSGAHHELRVDGNADRAVVDALTRTITDASELRENAVESLLAELAALGAAERGDRTRLRVDGEAYRGLGVDVGRCLALAEDANAPSKVRVAASRLLADHPDEDVRVRIANIAESTADPMLRDAVLSLESSRRARHSR